MVERGDDLTQLPGIGDDLAGKMREIVDTGSCRALRKLQAELPPAITELLHVPGLGPKRVRMLWHELEVQTPEQVARAARDGRIRELPGFGARTEANILQAVEAHLSKARRIKLATAAQYAASLTAWLSATRGVSRVELAGSYRRCRETVGDLDILVIAAAESPVMARFVAYDEVAEVLSQGPTRASLVLKSGLQVDLRVVGEASYGAALCYFTGSKAHNIALRRLAQERGLKLNEYGVFRGRERVAGADEESVYAALGLPFIAPELREDRGEIAAARAGRLPQLVQLADLRGDLHAHTTATDGHHTLEQMALAAKALGLSYLAITEHSRRLAMAHGLDPRRLAEQCDEIDRLNQKLEGIVLLKGIEVDILEDGSLDLPDASLARLDLVIGAVHSRFDLRRARQTERILRAMDNPVLHAAGPSHRPRHREPRALRRRHAARDPPCAAARLLPRTECPPRTPRPARQPLPDGQGRGRAGSDQLGRPQPRRPCPPALRHRPGAARLAGSGGRAQHAAAARVAASAGRSPAMNWETFAHEADVGVRGTGETLAEAFAGAATAMTAAICDPGKVGAGETVRIECAAPDTEMLLVDWLNALVYEMATRRMLFSRFEVTIEHNHLRATAWGEPVDVAKHQPAAEVKGASFCELAVRQEPDGRWLAQCVVDV